MHNMSTPAITNSLHTNPHTHTPHAHTYTHAKRPPSALSRITCDAIKVEKYQQTRKEMNPARRGSINISTLTAPRRSSAFLPYSAGAVSDGKGHAGAAPPFSSISAPGGLRSAIVTPRSARAGAGVATRRGSVLPLDTGIGGGSTPGYRRSSVMLPTAASTAAAAAEPGRRTSTSVWLQPSVASPTVKLSVQRSSVTPSQSTHAAVTTGEAGKRNVGRRTSSVLGHPRVSTSAPAVVAEEGQGTLEFGRRRASIMQPHPSVSGATGGGQEEAPERAMASIYATSNRRRSAAVFAGTGRIGVVVEGHQEETAARGDPTMAVAKAASTTTTERASRVKSPQQKNQVVLVERERVSDKVDTVDGGGHGAGRDGDVTPTGLTKTVKTIDSAVVGEKLTSALLGIREKEPSSFDVAVRFPVEG